ncbi:MAG: hypothetical protein JWO77_2985 [Ilumatobacteraceae bacterium]|nr:hypothetical protein [Ilumatobacteraceae bacterium]
MTAENEPDDSKPGAFKQAVAKAEEALGWATADRRVEAKGKLDQLEEPDPDATDAEVDHVLDEASLHVRADHGDLAPEVEPSDDEQPVKANPKTSG